MKSFQKQYAVVSDLLDKNRYSIVYTKKKRRTPPIRFHSDFLSCRDATKKMHELKALSQTQRVKRRYYIMVLQPYEQSCVLCPDGAVACCFCATGMLHFLTTLFVMWFIVSLVLFLNNVSTAGPIRYNS